MPHAITAGGSDPHESSSGQKARSVPARQQAVHFDPSMHPAELLHPSPSDVADPGLSVREVLRAVADTVTAKLLYDLAQERGAGARRRSAPPARTTPWSVAGAACAWMTGGSHRPGILPANQFGGSP